MKCTECGNDLMLSIEPMGWKKIIRLLPLASYRCLRCGNTALRFTASGYRNTAFGILLVALVLAGMAAAILYSSRISAPPAEPEHLTGMPVERRQVEPAENPALIPAPSQPGVEPVETTPGAEPVETPPMVEPAENPKETGLVERPSGVELVETDLTESSKPGTMIAEAPQAPPEQERAIVKAPEPLRLPMGPPAPSKAERQAAPAKTAPKTQAPAAAVTTGSGLTLASVGIARENFGTVVKLTSGAEIKDFSVFPLDNPPRRIIDLPGRWSYEGPKSFEIEDGGATRIRLGLHQDKLRLVIDYDAKKPAEPVVKTTPDGLLIVIR